MEKRIAYCTTLIAIALICIITFGTLSLTRNAGKNQKTISKETAQTQLAKMYKDIDPTTAEPISAPIDFDDALSLEKELPDIDTCKLWMNPTADINVEIFSSPEKAGDNNDYWLIDTANSFNKTNPTVNGKSASVQIRTVNSGQALDYIVSEKAIPQGWTPSASLWAAMANANNVNLETISEKLVGNTVGIVLKLETHEKLKKKYGQIDWKTITDAVEAKEIAFGYTNPNASTGGLNGIITTLQRYDSNDLFSEKATDSFAKFQKNIPLVSPTTMEMKKATENGSLDGFIMEYQSFVNMPDLKSKYAFTPYGYRHDNPLYACPNATDEEKDVLKQFAAFCESDMVQKKATDYGFNGQADYSYEYAVPSGETLLQAQALYKENKNAGKTPACVFVLDNSGSMYNNGKIQKLQQSLLNSMRYLPTDSYIGIVSFNDDVTIELPIKTFDMDQQCLFKGAVENLNPVGGTAAYDGICVAANMLQDLQETTDEPLKPMIFLLSDGQVSTGYGLNDIRPILESLRLSVHTIGYGEDYDQSTLESISSIGEASTTNASTEDVIYKMKTLFNNEL